AIPQAPAAREVAALLAAAGVGPAPAARSALGPAAYLADLLGFLRGVRIGGGKTALDVLYDGVAGGGPRPGLGALPLGGAALSAPVPRVELVLELLEQAVAGDVEPENAGAVAAAALGAATFPLALPFDRARSETRIYLEHVGVPRHEIMATFQ